MQKHYLGCAARLAEILKLVLKHFVAPTTKTQIIYCCIKLCESDILALDG